MKLTKNNLVNKSRKINLKIKFFATFRTITKKKEIEINVENESDISKLLDILFDTFNNLHSEIIDENNKVRDYVQILKNGRNIKYLDGLKTKLYENDVIAIFPPVAGGKQI